MDENDLKEKLSALKEEHRDLDDAITALTRAGTSDRLQLQRIKKKKLIIKDQIGKIKDRLFPDIIA